MRLARFTVRGDGGDWGDIKIMRPTPVDGDPWGDLAPLRETPWGDLITVVSGEALSHALHGHVVPLVRELGPHPHRLSRRVADQRCALWKGCVIAGDDCQPGKTLPECYSAPDLSLEAALAARAVALAWKEERYVIVVQGPEFSL